MGLERVFVAPWRLRQLCSRPLGAWLGDFCDGLLEQGFSWNSVRRHLTNVGHLNTWLCEEGRECIHGLSSRDIEGFSEAYRYRCRNRRALEDHLKGVRRSIRRWTTREAVGRTEKFFQPYDFQRYHQLLLFLGQLAELLFQPRKKRSLNVKFLHYITILYG